VVARRRRGALRAARFALFADRMVGKDFDAGLENLKALAEQP
jgi:hypothetical protein